MIPLDISLFLALLRAGILGDKMDPAPFAGQWDSVDPEAILALYGVYETGNASEAMVEYITKNEKSEAET